MNKKLAFSISFVIVAGILFFVFGLDSDSLTKSELGTEEAEIESSPLQRFDFSLINPTYRFSVELPEGWTAYNVSTTQAINVYDPRISGSSRLEQSLIFIRSFKASDFLTLDTVEILKREPTKLHGHDAVRYEIEKKPEVPDFNGQPSWRSKRHKLIDVRHDPTGATTFYVIAYSPDLDQKVFDEFLDSIVFK